MKIWLSVRKNNYERRITSILGGRCCLPSYGKLDAVERNDND